MGSFKTYVVIPNWNGARDLPACLDSLLAQTLSSHIVVVDNGSVDNSLKLLEDDYPSVEVISLSKNHGFAGGVNAGIKKAIEGGATYVALLNNDAVADKDWLKCLIGFMDKHAEVGISTSKILDSKKELLDSTGDIYTIWGLPFPRGRTEPVSDKYDNDTIVFGASGGASLYRTKMLKEIGLFDEDFFAYYEDVDLSFRAQLYGWKVAYIPEAKVYHQISATSVRIKGFAGYQTLKNLPLLMWKNVPAKLMLRVFPRFVFLYFMIWGRALSRGQIWTSSKGVLMSIILWPKKLGQRYRIQKNRKVSVEYIDSIITHDLPPNAHNLRKLRSVWWKIIRKKLS
jgi:GT2 family glycosyltransferase